MSGGSQIVIPPDGLELVVAGLRDRGYRVLGPTVRDGAIVYDDLESRVSCRSAGRTARTAAPTDSSAVRRGAVRLRRRPALLEALPLPTARAAVACATSEDGAPMIEEEPLDETPLAFVGVRSCELHAIEIQDRVFIGGTHVDRDYAARREGAFIVAVNCFEPGGTCFCASMGTGPERRGRVRPGVDRAARRRAPVPGRGRAAIADAEVLAELPARRRGRCRPAPRRPRRVEPRRAADGASDGHARHPRPARSQPRPPALGRGRHALPHLRQLHARLPDVLLLRGRGRAPTWPARKRSVHESGTTASPSTTPTSTAAASGRRGARGTGSG